MHVERIVRNAAAFNAFRPSLGAFFKDVLLPQLLRGQSSNKKNKTPNTSCSDGSSNTGTKYCQSLRKLNLLLSKLWFTSWNAGIVSLPPCTPMSSDISNPLSPTQCPLAQEVVRIHSAVCLSDTRPTQKRDTNEIVPAEGYSNQQLHGVVFLILLWVCLCTRLKCKRPLNKHFTSSFGVCLLKYLGHISLSHLLCWPFD